MATEAAPINGSYASEQGFNASTSATTSSAATTASGSGGAEIPKDEVGWYFVEQYYTTLSRSPEKLFLFYNKRSQFVSGTEEEKIAVCVGQKSIADRIKELDYQDCKVRITNVDSQGSDQHIVIQVIGEISNKHAPHRKFAQTFVLAAQTNGYFVLNDIFRYIADEDAEYEGEEPQEESTAPDGVHEPAPTATESGVGTLTNNADAKAREADAAKVDKSLEEAIEQEQGVSTNVVDEPANNDEPVENASTDDAEDTPVAAPVFEEKSDPPAAVAAEEETKQPEQPKEPEPTPVATPKPSQAPATAPSKPAAPKTWANLAAAAANRVALPQAPSSKVSVPTPPASTSAVAPTPSTASAPTAPAASTAPADPAAPSATSTQPPRDSSPAQSGGDSASGWQTAGADHSKRQSRVISQPAVEESTRAYIKNVFESVPEDDLKKELSKYGEVTYLDISRAKNCAFVDFATRSAFQAAVAANPHKIGDDNIFVEERRVRPQNQQFFPRGGGAPQRGRGDGRPTGQGRGGFKQDGGRGGFAPRARGGGAARGRGATQTA